MGLELSGVTPMGSGWANPRAPGLRGHLQGALSLPGGSQKLLPIFKGDFGRKGYPFLRIFLEKIDPFFKNFAIFAMRKPENLGSVRKVDPCLRIFWKQTGPMFKDFM